MKCLVIVLLSVAAALAQQEQPPPPPPQVNWGKCPQLEPTEAEQQSKGDVIAKCLEQNPPPPNSPDVKVEQLEAHREAITTCALKTEGWFNDDETYKFDRAKSEIEGKKLAADVSTKILEKHTECTQEAKEKFPAEKVRQVQLYQACMDFHITDICGIKIGPDGPQA